MQKWTIFGLALGIAIFAAVGFVVVTIRNSLRGVENAYAVWNVADLIIDHMQAHDDRWPTGWADLEAAYRDRTKSESIDAIRHYQSLVDVDFNTEPTKLAATPFTPGQADPPFKVIRHRRAPSWCYEGREPNEMIWYYLNGEYRSTSRPTSRDAPENEMRPQ